MSRRSERLEFLYRYYFHAEVYVPDEMTGIDPGSPPAIQQSFPTSAYGQTIPVLWGSGRVPGGYIWALPIKTTINESSVGVVLTARIRFARPLEANSNWKVRKIWAAGTLIYDRTQDYKSTGIQYLAIYDGQSTQDRDSLMVDEEGEDNVSAHRGYLDIVIKMDLGVAASAPPVFEAEWIQDATSAYDEDIFLALSDEDITHLMPYWAGGFLYAYSQFGELTRKFKIGSMHEISPQQQTAESYNNFRAFRYSHRLGMIVYQGAFTNHYEGVLISPTSPSIVDTTADITNTGLPLGAALVDLDSSTLYVGFDSHERVYIIRVGQTSLTLTYNSGTSWESYADIQCVTPGRIGATSADFYFCADNDVVKVVVSAAGSILSTTVVKTFSDAPRYCVYDGGYLVVWTDNTQVIRINGAGTVIFTKDLPYQIGVAGSRTLGDPDQQHLTTELLYQSAGTSYFTSLKTGTTTTATNSLSTLHAYFYNDVTGYVLTTAGVSNVVLVRGSFDVGDPATRDLEDFLIALMVSGGFDETEIDVVGVNDQILGAVIDTTGGVRDVARSVCEPYSIAIFERAGQIIFKRAATDGLFVTDATLSTTDFVDRGGQAIRATKRNPEETLSRYGINYRDPDEIYQSRPQYGEIPSLPFPVAPVDQGVKADIPIIATANMIKTLATKRVYKLAAQQHNFEFTLRAKYADIEPEDIDQFTYAGRTVSGRVLEMTLNPDFTVNVVGTEFLSETDISVSGATGRPIVPTPVGTPESNYYHLDIPLLDEGDDLASAGLVQYHVLTSDGQPFWDGASLYRLDTGGYVPVSAQTEDGIVGIATTLLPDWDIPYVTEFTRSVTFQVLTGDTSLMTSATYQEVCEGANKFAIGAPGRWEVCHVIDITDNADGTFTFTGLRRGRGVSEEHTASHAIGDYVVWLSDDNVQHLDYTLATLDDAFLFKAVGFGGTLADTDAVSRTITGEAEKIPKPCQLAAEIVASDIDLSWVRRSRIGAYWDDFGDYETPLGETLEQYIIRIKDAPGGTVLRTVTVDDATTYTYAAADITTDFGSLSSGDDLTFDIRQVSGTGVVCPTREATITL